MSARKKQANHPLLSPTEQRDILIMLYKETSENARYFDAHIWQIPSVTVAINAFLIGQTFSDNLQGKTWIQALLVLSAAFLTFVILLALVKHRLHKRGKDVNLRKIAKSLMVENKFIHEYQFPTELMLVEKKPTIILKVLSSVKANVGLMSVMVMTVLVDLVIFTGIVLGKF